MPSCWENPATISMLKAKKMEQKMQIAKAKISKQLVSN